MQHNQAVNPNPSHRVLLGGLDLQFHEASLADPVPTGRQIVEAFGGRPPEEFIVLQWLTDGDLEELDADETVDLRQPGRERFIIAKSDRSFRFEIDSRKHEWPAATITREVLLALAGQDPNKFSVWLERRGQQDLEVLSGHPASLDPAGTERFYTVMTKTTEGHQ